MLLRPAYFLYSLISIPPLVFILNFPDEMSYFLIALLFCLHIVLLALSGNISSNTGNLNFILISILVPITWLTSSIIGLINGADGLNAIRNFFGLNLFIIIFLFSYSGPSLRDIERSILFANLLVFLGLLINLREFSLQAYLVSLSLQEYRLFYTAIGINTVPAITICIYKLLTPKRVSRKITLFYLFQLTIALIVAFVTFSKGILLTILLILFIYFVSFLIEFRRLRLSPQKIIYLFSFVIITVIIISSPIFETIKFLYSNREASNSVRSDQLSYLLNELHFWGAGLGTELKSGYKRDDLGYGFELTLVNLVQKMGIFSILYFLIISVTVLRATFWVMKGKSNRSMVLSLSCMLASLVSGTFNPLLFSPVSVILQIIGIYLVFNKTRHRYKDHVF